MEFLDKLDFSGLRPDDQRVVNQIEARVMGKYVRDTYFELRQLTVTPYGTPYKD